MEQEKAAKVLLVRAVEEILPNHIPSETLLESHLAAGNPAEGLSWIVRRAEFLLNTAISSYDTVLQRIETINPSIWLPVGISAFIGLISNYLGPSEKIHVLWNPIILLIGWNILIYVFLAIGFPFRKKDVPITKPSAPPVHVKEQKHRKYRPRFTERFIIGPLFSWLLGLRTGVDEISGQAAQIRAVGRRFSTLWWPVVLPHLRLWLERTLHLCSIGMAIGAISGIYLRGLILEYEIIWRSTFIKDPLKIQKALEIIFSPVLFFLGPTLPSDVELLKAGGANAEGWFHLYAAYALLIIILPRSILALTSSKRLAKLSTVVQLSFDDEYYVDLFKKATMVSPKELEAATKKIVAEECSQISENLSTFVCEKLYDDRITPKLWDFREHGGSLKSLEETLSNECLSFRSDLEFEIGNAEKILDDKIAHRISRLLGDDSGVACKPVEGLMGQVDEASSKAAVHVGEKVSRDLAAIVAGTVSTSVAVVAGTLSGGFGNSIGIALLTGLVHSGPVAWVIGAVGALIATGATLALGRDKLRKSVKSVPIPAAALKVALWQNRYERLIADGRKNVEIR